MVGSDGGVIGEIAIGNAGALEDAGEGVVVGSGDRVEFVVVATGAGDSESHGAAGDDIDAVIQRGKLFCTFFDNRSGRYAVDYSFVIALTVGGLALLGLAFFLVRALWGLHHSPRGPA